MKLRPVSTVCAENTAKGHLENYVPPCCQYLSYARLTFWMRIFVFVERREIDFVALF